MDSVDTDGDGNGDNRIRFTNNLWLTDEWPAWSPSGSKIAFMSRRDGNSEIYMMVAADIDGDGNGDNQTRLTTNPAFDCCPGWDPASFGILFSSPDRDGNWEIYVTDIDRALAGGPPINIANNSTFDWLMDRCSLSISVGIESNSIRRREALSSIKSIALSGRFLSGMYLLERRIAASNAGS